MEFKEKIRLLTCSQCGEVKKQYSALVFSQGDLVCLSCKEKNRKIDNGAYDNYVTR